MGPQAAQGQEAMPVVEVTSVSFSYDRRPVLQNVSFRVDSRQIFGLLGPNGSGKTTLFRILCTLLPLRRGTARVAGWDVVDQPQQVRRAIGVVFQSSTADPEFSVFENLSHQGHLYGLRGRPLRERIQEVAARLGLQDRLSDRVGTLSGGLRRRLDLAKSLLHSPQLLLLDEPTSGLDPAIRREFWDHLWLLSREDGVSVLLTTHLMGEAERCDRLAILKEGQVVAAGTPDALKQRIGGDVIIIHTRHPEELQRRIQEEFGCAPLLVNGSLRIEQKDGHLLVSRLMDRFPGEVEAVTLGKPTLEDVFIHETGGRFAEGQPQPSTRP